MLVRRFQLPLIAGQAFGFAFEMRRSLVAEPPSQKQDHAGGQDQPWPARCRFFYQNDFCFRHWWRFRSGLIAWLVRLDSRCRRLVCCPPGFRITVFIFGRFGHDRHTGRRCSSGGNVSRFGFLLQRQRIRLHLWGRWRRWRRRWRHPLRRRRAHAGRWRKRCIRWRLLSVLRLHSRGRWWRILCDGRKRRSHQPQQENADGLPQFIFEIHCH